jgi:hypothetical protein
LPEPLKHSLQRKFSALLVIAALIFMVFAAMPVWNGHTTFAQSASTHDGYWLRNSITFNTYGQFFVNETLNELQNSTTSLSTVTFGFPSAYNGHLVDQTAFAYTSSSRYNASVSQALSNNTLLLTVSFQPALSAGANGSVSLGFYVTNTFVPTNASNYNVSMLFYPSVNMPLNKIVSQIILPYVTTHVSDGSPLRNKGFSQTVNGTNEIWANTFTNQSFTSPSFASVNVNSVQGSSGSVDFTSVSRQLTIDSSGAVTVTDSITLENLGRNTLTGLNYNPLSNSTSLTLIPSSQTLLSNVQSVSLSGGQISLSGINAQVEPNSSETIIIQYKLSNQYLTYSNGVYSVNVPSAPPVTALIDNYKVSVTTSSGIVFTSGSSPPSINLMHTTGSLAPITFSYRLGIASAYGSAMPIAALVFIAVFGMTMIFRPRKSTEEGATDTLDSLIRLVEDKASGTNDILSELKSKGVSVSRNDLITARSRIEELRNKTSGRLGILRSQLSSTSVTLQSGLNQIVSNDREFDRIVRDELNSYDQFVSKKMKDDTFGRVIQGYDRRLQQVTNAYLDSVHDLREEYESEG